jgi:ABC-type antimicrobial peptide transport system permease subunit
LPLSIDQSNSRVIPEDRQTLSPADAPSTIRYKVSPAYFRTLGIRMVSGRDVGWSDTAAAQPVAVVNETFARTILRSSDPVGRRFRYGWSGTFIQVIGVVADGKYQSLTEHPTAATFESIMQSNSTTTALLVRSARPQDQIAGEIRRTIAGIAPDIPLFGEGSVERMLGFAMFPMRAAASALGLFGLLAVVLSATGIHSLVTYAVSQRQREIGIRMAIGASAGSVLRLVLGRIAALVAAGAAAGLLLSLASGRLLQDIVYQVSPHDPATLAGVLTIFGLVALAACWAPARRSIAINPSTALRAD